MIRRSILRRTAAAGGACSPRRASGFPGTFDQDVYVELLRRFHEADSPADGALSFTLHAFLRSMGRRVDGRTYEQLRAALTRLERTTLESHGVYHDAAAATRCDRPDHRALVRPYRPAPSHRSRPARAVFDAHEQRAGRRAHRLFIAGAGKPRGRSHHHAVGAALFRAQFTRRPPDLPASGGRPGRDGPTWRVPLERLAAQLPLVQRYPSHLQRVLQPAHEMLVAAGLLRDASFEQDGKTWFAEYSLGPKGS